MKEHGAVPGVESSEMLVSESLVGTPSPPPTMTPEEVHEALGQATEFVRAVRESSGSKQLAVLDEVTSVGLQSQRNAGRQLELVKTRLATLLDDDGASRAIAGDLVDLRTTLERINPASEQRRVLARVVGSVPFLRGSALVRALTRIAVRYEPVSKQITIIETKLREGRSLLARDNVELRHMYEDVEAQQEAITRQVFVGEILMHEFTRLVAQTDDPLRRDRVQDVLHDVATRVQDLRMMQEVHVQYFLSIELTRQNNNRLGQAVDRTLALATNVVTVGLALQAALVRQRGVKEATLRTRSFLGEMITQNANAIRRQTEEIGDLYNDPVIAMDKLLQAHQDLLAALDTASRLREQGISTARTNIQELAGLTHELAQHVQGHESRDAGRVR